MVFPTLTPKLCNNKLKGTSGGAAGYYRDFPIVIDYFQPNDEFTLQINISSKYDPDNSELERYWQAKKLTSNVITLVTVTPYSIILTLSAGFLAVEKEYYINFYCDKLIDYLIENNYTPCCEACGIAHLPLSCYVINDKTAFMCGNCYQKKVDTLEKEKEEILAHKSNFPLGLLGAFIGALLGCMLYVYMYHFQARIKGAVGLLIGILSIKGYKKLGKNLDVKGAIACIILFIVMIYASHYISTALSYIDIYAGTYSFSYICANLFSILQEHGRYNTFFRHLLGVYIMCGMSSFGTLFGALFDSTGTYTSYKVDIKK